MFRRCLIEASPTIRGRPFKQHNNPIAIHQKWSKEASNKIDLSALGLIYKSIPLIDRENGPYPPSKYDNSNLTVVKPKYRQQLQNLSISTEGLPFSVERTQTSMLPVYTDIKGGQTKIITMLCKCRGDIQTLKDEMQKVCDDKEITVRAGKLLVTGNYVRRIKVWLTGLGL
mmetsp:Transcript_27779/g.26589  ORF Transcript_27779/g.26589 Transcript_27779/m.26589 type:complete len:171 (-) Transcript_27779:167-679(-)